MIWKLAIYDHTHIDECKFTNLFVTGLIQNVVTHPLKI